MKCHKCGTPIMEVPDGIYLQRVNEKGVDGIWECRPNCGQPLPSQDAAVLAAIQGEEPKS